MKSYEMSDLHGSMATYCSFPGQSLIVKEMSENENYDASTKALYSLICSLFHSSFSIGLKSPVKPQLRVLKDQCAALVVPESYEQPHTP